MAPPPERPVEPADIARARVAVADIVRQTPVLPSLTLSEHTDAEVVLKAENLQRTGSFKNPGALKKIPPPGAPISRGGTSGAAGTHAGGGAHAARSPAAPYAA